MWTEAIFADVLRCLLVAENELLLFATFWFIVSAIDEAAIDLTWLWLRFNGHTEGEPYSVAHHSMLVADLLASWGAPPAIVREGLLHDAGEAYYGDVVSPLKRAMVAGICRDVSDFEMVAERVDLVVRKTLGLNPDQSHLVRRADLVALAIERRDLFGACERDWHLGEYAPTSAPCGRIQHGAYDTRIRPAALIRWETARDRFLELLTELDVAILASREVAS